MRLIKATRAFMAVIALGAGAMGCTAHDIVTINYEQIGACNGFNDGQTATTAGANAAYVVFRVSSVDNKDTNARDFDFDPNQLFVNSQAPRAYTRTTLRLAQLNPFYATARHVAAQTSESINGAVIAVVSTTAADGASEANNHAYTLLYEGVANGQGMIMQKKDPGRSAWPQISDCQEITY
jgi:hypothetical protein